MRKPVSALSVRCGFRCTAHEKAPNATGPQHWPAIKCAMHIESLWRSKLRSRACHRMRHVPSDPLAENHMRTNANAATLFVCCFVHSSLRVATATATASSSCRASKHSQRHVMLLLGLGLWRGCLRWACLRRRRPVSPPGTGACVFRVHCSHFLVRRAILPNGVAHIRALNSARCCEAQAPIGMVAFLAMAHKDESD